MASLEYWTWLSAAAVSARTKALVVRHFGDAEAAFFSPDGAIARLEGVTQRDAAILEKRELGAASAILERCELQNLRVLTMQDAAYPKRLKHIYDPPVVLYVKGKLPNLDSAAPIAVIGTRRATHYGLQMARNLSDELVRCGAIVVSGLTSGIDAEAARAALRAGGCCIGVLGTAHEEERGRLAEDVAGWGALLSEYPPGTETLRSFFRERNRIAAGISVGVLVVEAPEKSGTRLFVSEAAEQGKEIFAVPGNVGAENSVGTLAFIQEGAKLVTSGWDVINEFTALYPELHPPVDMQRRKLTSDEAPQPAQAPAEKAVDKPEASDYIDWKEQLAGLSAEQLAIVTALGKDAVHVDDLIEKTGLPTARVLVQLTVLEVRGLIRREPGRRISLKVVKK